MSERGIKARDLSLSLVGYLMAFFMLSVASIQGVSAQEVDNYYTRFTSEGRQSVGATGVYSKDMHVWVYTSEFAKRFGMPKKWIDDGLEGAEALAYRIDLDLYGIKCGYFGEQENCRPATACIVDMYIDDGANLPWNTNNRAESRYGKKSIGVLAPQNDNDNPMWWKRITKRGGQYKLGLDVVYVSGSKIPLNNYHMLEYDRDIYSGLDYVSGAMTCRSFGKSRDIKIRINDPVIGEDGWIKYNQPNRLAHAITVPNSFMQRIEQYDQAQYEPHSLFKTLKERLSNTNKDN